jgi:hypothetical protein
VIDERPREEKALPGSAFLLPQILQLLQAMPLKSTVGGS